MNGSPAKGALKSQNCGDTAMPHQIEFRGGRGSHSSVNPAAVRRDLGGDLAAAGVSFCVWNRRE